MVENDCNALTRIKDVTKRRDVKISVGYTTEHMSAFSITHTTRTYPRHSYKEMKDDILGASYELSLVFIGKTRARALNKAHRQKTYVPNVLSFPVTKNVGEIFITPEVAKKEAAAFNMTPRGYIGYLFIHGLLHLKGYAHGRSMDQAEKRYIAKYKLV